ncbi:MAG: hypothetical protein HY472_00535 [Candidatus Sungbacteria bacterium]|nr:hypothetical protein [Candidatus Sungbacteria bacterium]
MKRLFPEDFSLIAFILFSYVTSFLPVFKKENRWVEGLVVSVISLALLFVSLPFLKRVVTMSPQKFSETVNKPLLEASVVGLTLFDVILHWWYQVTYSTLGFWVTTLLFLCFGLYFLCKIVEWLLTKLNAWLGDSEQ